MKVKTFISDMNFHYFHFDIFTVFNSIQGYFGKNPNKTFHPYFLPKIFMVHIQAVR